jgi:hypothetical protein
MRAAIRTGVDDLITDRPDLLHPSARHKLQMVFLSCLSRRLSMRTGSGESYQQYG